MADQPSAPDRHAPRIWSHPNIQVSALLLIILVIGLTVWRMQPPAPASRAIGRAHPLRR